MYTVFHQCYTYDIHYININRYIGNSVLIEPWILIRHTETGRRVLDGIFFLIRLTGYKYNIISNIVLPTGICPNGQTCVK